MPDEPAQAENEATKRDAALPLEDDRLRIENSIEADMAELKRAMESAVGGGTPAGTAEDQLRILEEMHARLQKLTDALRDYAKGVQNP